MNNQKDNEQRKTQDPTKHSLPVSILLGVIKPDDRQKDRGVGLACVQLTRRRQAGAVSSLIYPPKSAFSVKKRLAMQIVPVIA